MTAVALLAAGGVAAGAAALAGAVVPPAPRLAPRVRPYSGRIRRALGLLDPVVPVGGHEHARTALGRLFGPPTRAAVGKVARVASQSTDDELARLLHQAGRHESPDEYRVRQLRDGVVGAVLGGGAVALLLHAPVAALLAGVAGIVAGLTRSRRRLERAVADRAALIRLELYTVNHLLAMQVRTGAGPIQAVQRLVERGRGAAVGELREVLAWIRSGTGEAAAFRRAAELTPEPSAARTYQLMASGVERGVDLGSGLLALSEDIRDARREQLHKEAVRRRAAMLIPTIGILAPIMLLFIAAPLPSIVLGQR
ncbi:MAG TPA: type II secretion system F family protein [Solirubrobacteraceae bacterium]|nr:type II secretion system F family protein [Solirubrobacteraceae bacterium]